MKYLVLILISSIILAACDLFTTRIGEKPNQSGSNYQPPVQPEIVISNLENSFNDKNAENYIKCFVNEVFADKQFIFSASSEAYSIYPVFSQNWGLNEETVYFRNVLLKVTDNFPTLTFSNESYSNLGGDSLIYTASYNINLPISVSDPTPANYAGVLQFNMLRDSRSEWVIYFWKDTKSETLPSWSELKGIFY